MLMTTDRIWALNRIIRFTGWTRRPYSVLEHSVIGAQVLAELVRRHLGQAPGHVLGRDVSPEMVVLRIAAALGEFRVLWRKHHVHRADREHLQLAALECVHQTGSPTIWMLALFRVTPGS